LTLTTGSQSGSPPGNLKAVVVTGRQSQSLSRASVFRGRESPTHQPRAKSIPRAETPLAAMSASLIGRLGSSAFRLSTTTVSMSLAGPCFSSESAPGPFHHGFRGRGGTICWAALPSYRQQVQADIRTRLIHRPARDIIPPLRGAPMSSYPVGSGIVLMLLPQLVPGSTGTRCRQPRCGA
jgi:hypothetical protein